MARLELEGRSSLFIEWGQLGGPGPQGTGRTSPAAAVASTRGATTRIQLAIRLAGRGRPAARHRWLDMKSSGVLLRARREPPDQSSSTLAQEARGAKCSPAAGAVHVLNTSELTEEELN